MAKTIIMIKCFISVDIDNYRGIFQIFISSKFKAVETRSLAVVVNYYLWSEHDKPFVHLIVA